MKTKKLFSLLIALLVTTVGVIAQQGTSTEPDAARLQQHVSYLASDALDGRRTGTQGANDAARYIAGEFSRLGLRPAFQKAGASKKLSVAMSQYLQQFPYVGAVELGQASSLSAQGKSSSTTLRVGEDWMPLAFSSNQKIDNAKFVFAGYGISSSELNYNDYPEKYTNNQVAVVFAGTPDGDNPHGKFARAGELRFKVAAARNAGASALVVISAEKDFRDDKFSRLSYDNAGEAGIPVLAISRSAASRILALTGSNPTVDNLERLADLKRVTAKDDKPISGVGFDFPIPNSWLVQDIKLTIAPDVIRKDVPAYNVIAVLDGSDRLLKNETIIIGAHYDHLGRGGEGSLAPRSGEIHHGADDNASGTAGVLELARVLTAQRPKLKRTVVFITFSGEEEGLLGSNYYVNHPFTPLTNTVAMINMDMIGRMKDRKLVIGGVGTAKEWRDLLGTVNRIGDSENLEPVASKGQPITGPARVNNVVGAPIAMRPLTEMFALTLNEDGYGPSDHSSFYSKQVPVLFFWTGTHNDYHKPSDTFEKINYNDEAQILTMVARIVRHLDASDKRLTFTTARSDATPRSGGFRVYLGTIPNYADSTNGLLIDGVRDDSPAAKAGLKAGDRIVKIGTREVKDVYDYTYALGEMKAGEEYVLEVVRGTEKLTLKIKPEARK
jgi:aminopeptidase YwaD